MTFPELVEQYSTPESIPNDVLHDWMMGHFEGLINEQKKLGLQRVPESAVGREVRRRCKADLFWLARYFTWYTNPASDGGTKPISENLIDEEHYKVVCDLFIKKDDTKSMVDQSPVKTRMLLWPRTGMKSTIDHVDSVQWVLNFPSIRILYLTAEASLAKGFVGEIKGHFTIREDNPSPMQIFFPEFCLLEKDMGAGVTFTCPVYAAKKTKRKEPTVIASSVGKNKSGWHYELIKADDAVSDKNSESSEQCESISQKLFLAEKLLNLGGYYIDYIGTRYADEDHYGQMLEQNVGEIVETKGQGWVYTENKSTGVNMLIGRAIQIKPEIAVKLEQEGKPVSYQEAGPDGCVLLLPHIMDFKWLMNDFSKNEKSFEGQRNQNPRPASQITFDRVLLLRSTVPYQKMPLMGAVSQVWDFAFSKKKGRDYTVGVSIIWTEEDELEDELDDKGVRTGQKKKTGNKHIVGYVQEIIRDRFNPLQLARAVVDLAEKYKPFVVGVEGVAGSHYIGEQIRVEAVRKKNIQLIQVCTNIDWFPPDNQKDAKKTRMGSLYPLMVQGRLKFANYCMQPNLELLYSEFEKCLTSHHHDDIPDAIGMQLRYAPRASVVIINNDIDMLSRRDPTWNLIFAEDSDQFGRIGFGGFPQPAPIKDQEDFDDWPSPPNGLPCILGAGIRG